MAKRQVISCPWQDEQGNVLALGRIVFEASGDALVTGTGELCAGIKGELTLDVNGTVAASPAQYMWPTDQMSPSNITYTVWVYNAEGQLAWGPNYGLLVPSGAGSFNLCTWVPNQIGGGSGASAGSLTLQVEGVNNAVQSLLNLESLDDSIIITDEGNGSVNFQVAGGANKIQPTQLQFAVPIVTLPGNNLSSSPLGVMQDISAGGTATLTATFVPPTSTEAGYLLSSTDSTNPGLVYIANTGSAGPILSPAYFQPFFIRGYLFLGGNAARYWIGLTDDQSPATGFLQSANPPKHIMAFRFDPSVPDTHWQAYCSLDASNFTVVNTGVVPDFTGAHHDYEARTSVQGTPGTIDFYIDGAKVATISTHVPSATALGHIIYTDSVTPSTPGTRQVGANLFQSTLFQ